MLFSVIIPTYKRNDQLTLCLQRLQPGVQTLESHLYEVIVTDDAADPATAALLGTQFPWATYTAGPQRGPAANRNHGASLANGQWLVFTDDDCLPDEQWLHAYSDAITAHPECRAFEGAILPDDWAILKKDMAECPVNTEGGCFWSANIMVKRKLFQSVGGFDEQFLIAAQEDQDLQWRIQQQHSIVFVPAAQVVHPVRVVSWIGKMRRCRMEVENYQKFMTKHRALQMSAGKYQPFWWQGVRIQTKVGVQQLLRGNFRRALVAFYTALFGYLPKI